jgi:hypothetical protein
MRVYPHLLPVEIPHENYQGRSGQGEDLDGEENSTEGGLRQALESQQTLTIDRATLLI